MAVRAIEDDVMRLIKPHWDSSLVAASIAVSLLGAFTSTQLMCQARLSRYLSGVLVWTALGSLTFGFASIFCLHFVAMLALQMDVKIGLNTSLTVLSAVLAVLFTFIALASDLFWERFQRQRQKGSVKRRWEDSEGTTMGDRLSGMSERRQSRDGLLAPSRANSFQGGPLLDGLSTSSMTSPPRGSAHSDVIQEWNGRPRPPFKDTNYAFFSASDPRTSSGGTSAPNVILNGGITSNRPSEDDLSGSILEDTHASEGLRSEVSPSYQSSGFVSSDDSTVVDLRGFNSIRFVQNRSNKTSFMAQTVERLSTATLANVIKGFFWSLAITSMHYVGIMALEIPAGTCTLQPGLVILSALISWLVCFAGSVFMAHMEIHLGQQLLFSSLATCGVAAMHFTGMTAASFWTSEPPSAERGYPQSLPIVLGIIAVSTCLLANGLLAHSATLARNKLIEIVHTRQRLWAAIAQKENAEAAALARAEFIASASHEIRTPLHQLQGYSDLLIRTKLTKEGRLLLHAIQDATRSLSLITNNVLDWSRLEVGEATCRPTALDVRSVCESVVNLLPNKDADADVELLVVVPSDIPHSLLIDETYLHRIIMNLVSNSLKFTSSGYVLLKLHFNGSDLVVTVVDTGCGIPQSFLPELFEPFKQAQTRGAQRGTGLGLSIVKQLLTKMRGTIRTESRFRDDEGIGPENSGTKFIVTIPVHSTSISPAVAAPANEYSRLALLTDHNDRLFEGIRTAWEAYDVQVSRINRLTDLTSDYKYVWVDVIYLRRHRTVVQQLMAHTKLTILIPYDSERALTDAVGNSPPSHFLPIPTPLLWHQMIDRIQIPEKIDTSKRLVRFASQVDLVPEGRRDESSDDGQEPCPSPGFVDTSSAASLQPLTVMLVEDNRINQTLGAKMLRTLGYDVVLANDGQEAIDLILEYDSTVEAILMDQSMPRKDGLTATKEIRELEENGSLRGTRRIPGQARRPIIAVTAVVGPKAEAMFKESGTDTFLSKPLSLVRLRETLDMFLYPTTDRDDAHHALNSASVLT